MIIIALGGHKGSTIFSGTSLYFGIIKILGCDYHSTPIVHNTKNNVSSILILSG